MLLHAQALLRSSPQGATDYVQADLRDPGLILERAAGLLDFGQPVAVMLLGADERPVRTRVVLAGAAGTLWQRPGSDRHAATSFRAGERPGGDAVTGQAGGATPGATGRLRWAGTVRRTRRAEKAARLPRVQ